MGLKGNPTPFHRPNVPVSYNYSSKSKSELSVQAYSGTLFLPNKMRHLPEVHCRQHHRHRSQRWQSLLISFQSISGIQPFLKEDGLKACPKQEAFFSVVHSVF